MGYSQAESWAEEVTEGHVSLTTALSWHLGHNHYPPVSLEMVFPCIDAISAFNDEDFDQPIKLPDGVTFRDETTAPASAIIESFHLEPFLDHGGWE